LHQLGGVFPNPVTTHAKHRGHGARVEVLAHLGTVMKQFDDPTRDRLDVSG